MSDLESVSFKISLSADWFRKPQRAKIYLDDELIDDVTIEERRSEEKVKILEFSKDLAEGEHTLSIQYLDKRQNDTKVDDDHNIIEDHLLHIEEIEIDEIELGYLAYKLSKFYPDRSERQDLPEEMDELVTLGYNGTWKINFSVSTYIWFLDNL